MEWRDPGKNSEPPPVNVTKTKSTNLNPHSPMPDSHDIRFLQHALDLARKGIGLASPNPTVGCVIVKDGAILGEGFHQYDWRDHAEIVALKQARDKAKGATLYVTLEPCNHTGRTGACSEAIVAAGIARVVAAMEDPNPKTQGTGFARLRAAGIEVETGLLESEARQLNEGFISWITTRRPFVTLKSALTLDGQLALPSSGVKKKRAWITGEESRAEVHRMRHASDALLTGIGTILADDPLLTDRSGLPRRRRLLRVILDSRLRLSPKARIVATADDDLLVFTAAALKSPKGRGRRSSPCEISCRQNRSARRSYRTCPPRNSECVARIRSEAQRRRPLRKSGQQTYPLLRTKTRRPIDSSFSHSYSNSACASTHSVYAPIRTGSRHRSRPRRPSLNHLRR